MTDLTYQCPVWCQAHEVDELDVAVHEWLLGRAGPLEVTMTRTVLSEGTPVDEVRFRDVGGESTGYAEVTTPLGNMERRRIVAEILGQVAERLGASSLEELGWSVKDWGAPRVDGV